MLIALGLALAGLACIAASEVLARRFQRRYVIGRILAVAPQVSLAEAGALAEAGDARYVRIHGRISSAEEFPDENDRPLVYRRKRIEVRPPGRPWRLVADEVEGVPFAIEERGAAVEIDAAALGEGLIVLPRESTGLVGDLPAAIERGGAPPDAQARLVIEQVSAVEHAFACGVALRVDGRTVLSSGARRPLILTTLDLPVAMRVLAAGRRVPATMLGGLVGTGIVLLAGAAVAAVAALAIG